MSYKIEQEIEVFKRKCLEERLLQCTQKQREFFLNRVHPNGVRSEDLIEAIKLCDRTLEGNLKLKN